MINYVECIKESLENLGIHPREIKTGDNCSNLSFTLIHRFSPSLNVDIEVGSSGDVAVKAVLPAVIQPRVAVIDHINFLAASKRYLAMYLDEDQRVVCKYSFLLGGDDDTIVNMCTKVISMLLAEVSSSAYQIYMLTKSYGSCPSGTEGKYE